MSSIEELRASMAANVTKLSGKGNYLPLGTYACDLQIEKFFFKKPSEKTPLGLFIAEFKALKSSSPDVQIGEVTYSEGFDPTKSGWEHRLLKFLLSSLGVDWRGAVPAEATQLAVDIRFSVQEEGEHARMVQKYSGAPEDLLVGRKVVAQVSPYKTKKDVVIASAQWMPYVAPTAPAANVPGERAERCDTPVISHGSGEFLRDQASNGMRQLCETMAECPAKGCTGGKIRTSIEVGTGYRVTIRDCSYCDGVGVVPKWRVV